MKEFNVKVKHNEIESDLKKLVQNDYNSIDLLFELEIEAIKYSFKLLYPDQTIWVKEIIDNKITLPILSKSGNYQYEISCYDENGKLTSTAIGSFYARSELVKTDEEVERDDRLPILDDLINRVSGLGDEVIKNEDQRIENEKTRQENEEERKEYYQEIQRKVKDGEFDGKSLEFNWKDTSLGVKVEGEEEYQYSELKGEPGADGKDGEDGKDNVYIGQNPGEDDKVWIDPEGEPDTFEAKEVIFADGKDLQFKLDNGELGGGSQENIGLSVVNGLINVTWEDE